MSTGEPAGDGSGSGDSGRTDHATIATRFANAGGDTDRFVSVRDGGKACFDHDTRYNDPRQIPGQNYGVYADADGPLVVLDIDDYRGEISDGGNDGVKALFDLPPTLETRSPHGGTHKFYRVDSDSGDPPADVLDAELGARNPEPSWGEVQVANKYVVGAGSQLDGCSKEWCDECADPDGGRYAVQSDHAIATVDVGALVEVLAADPELGAGSTPSGAAAGDGTPTVEAAKTDSQTAENAGPTEFDEWLDEDLASEALDHVDPDVNYPVWRNIGFALADRFATGTAKRLFKQWSSGGSKWDRDADRQADRIIDDARGGSVTPATLVYHAKEGGWDPPAGAPSTDELLSEHSGGDEPVPFWLLRQAAIEFGVCDRDDLVEHETDTGETYLGFDAPTYNAALRALDANGIDHGRDPIETDARSAYYDVDLPAFVDDPDADPWSEPDTMLRACLRARHAGAVSEYAGPPTLALLPLRRDVLNQEPNRDMTDGTRDLLEDLFFDLGPDDVDDVLGE